jgi:hypothetical protein
MKNRMPDTAAAGPVAKSNLADQLGLDPMGIAWKLGIGGEGAGVGMEVAQLGPQLAQSLLAEAGAHVACIPQAAFLVMHAQQQRAQAGARTPRIGEAADDELLALATLELDPVG